MISKFQELLTFGNFLISTPGYTKGGGGLRADQKWHTPRRVPTKIHLWTHTCLLSGEWLLAMCLFLSYSFISYYVTDMKCVVLSESRSVTVA